MNAGVLLQNVRIELDDDTKLDVNLRLQHVTSLNAERAASAWAWISFVPAAMRCARCSASST